jgi:hypothetical protein
VRKMCAFRHVSLTNSVPLLGKDFRILLLMGTLLSAHLRLKCTTGSHNSRPTLSNLLIILARPESFPFRAEANQQNSSRIIILIRFPPVVRIVITVTTATGRQCRVTDQGVSRQGATGQLSPTRLSCVEG